MGAVILAGLIAAAMAAPPPEPPAAKCSVGKIVEFPITMVNRRPMVSAQFGTKEARFILDSGAFYSTLSRASAAEFGLKVDPAPPSFRLRGINGDTSIGIATAKEFTLAGVKLPHVEFIVGGSDFGTAGLLGRNFLGLADVEYDLPHGTVRLMKTAGCKGVALSYWAKDRPISGLPLEVPPTTGPFKPDTMGTVILNGVKIRAVFDSGAPSSLLTLAAAKKVGITPDSPGVTPAGTLGGLGTRAIRAWGATFDKIDIGGEVINHPKIAFGQMDLQNADMLIGADFFLTHRIFVSNANRVMYLTYEGGPVFGLNPKGASTAEGKAIDLTDKGPAPTTAEEFSRAGAVASSNRRFAEALKDFDKAIELAPKEGKYFYQRAMANMASGQRQAALADLDRSIELAPGDMDARLLRAGFRLRNGNASAGLDDLKVVDAGLAPSSDKRMRVAALFDFAEMPDRSLANYDLWLKSHSEDQDRAIALNGRCWARALLNRDLDKALDDCDGALGKRPGNPAFLDSRALVRMRRGDLKQALADYNAALKAAPRNAWSLYARGIVEAKMGNADKAKADRAAALAIDPKVADRARKFGIEG